MLEQADRKKVYKDLIHLRLGGADFMETFPQYHKNRYDVVAGSLIEPNNFDENLFSQMLFALKAGGFLVFSSQHSYIGYFEYNEGLDQLVKAQRIKLIETKILCRYDKPHRIIGKYDKTPAIVYVYQK